MVESSQHQRHHNINVGLAARPGTDDSSSHRTRHRPFLEKPAPSDLEPAKSVANNDAPATYAEAAAIGLDSQPPAMPTDMAHRLAESTATASSQDQEQDQEQEKKATEPPRLNRLSEAAAAHRPSSRVDNTDRCPSPASVVGTTPRPTGTSSASQAMRETASSSTYQSAGPGVAIERSSKTQLASAGAATAPVAAPSQAVPKQQQEQQQTVKPPVNLELESTERVQRVVPEQPRLVELTSQKHIREHVLPEVTLLRDKPLYEIVDVPVARTVQEPAVQEDVVGRTRYAELRTEEARLADSDVRELVDDQQSAPIQSHMQPDTVERIKEPARLVRERDLVRIERHVRPVVHETHVQPVERFIHVPFVETYHDDPRLLHSQVDFATLAASDSELAAQVASSLGPGYVPLSVGADSVSAASGTRGMPKLNAQARPFRPTGALAGEPESETLSASLKQHARSAGQGLKQAAHEVGEASADALRLASAKVRPVVAPQVPVSESADWWWQAVPTAFATAFIFGGLMMN